jgi:hypothetical protein
MTVASDLAERTFYFVSHSGPANRFIRHHVGEMDLLYDDRDANRKWVLLAQIRLDGHVAHSIVLLTVSFTHCIVRYGERAHPPCHFCYQILCDSRPFATRCLWSNFDPVLMMIQEKKINLGDRETLD